jgi:hypothetical protein
MMNSINKSYFSHHADVMVARVEYDSRPVALHPALLLREENIKGI